MISYLLEHNRYLNLVGIAVIIGLAVLLSRKRSHIKWRLILHALLLQLGIALLVLKTSIGKGVVGIIAQGVSKIYAFADEGSQFVFGKLAINQAPWGVIFAFKVLPVIIFFGALN